MAVQDPSGPTTEIGSLSGESKSFPAQAFGGSWSSWGGGDGIERVSELQWPQSVITYPSMMNDAQVFSLLNGLILPIKAYHWYLDENGARPEITERISADYNLPIGADTEFNRRRGARRFSFDKHIEDALRALWYGHYFFEQVGEITDDLVWHLRKLAPRAPRTLTEINVARDGMLESIRQGTGIDEPVLPTGRLVAYVWDREGSNWTGRSMLRSVYRNYIVKDRVLRVGAINIERAGGVPYVEAPEGASGDQIRELDALARRFRVGEGAGAALPHGAQLKFAIAAGGDGAVAYLKQQNEEMSRAFFQMVIMLGQTNSGSRALGGTFQEMLQVGQYSIAKWFADTFNEHVIEDDVEWNEGPAEEYAPLLKFDAGLQDPMGGLQAAADDNTADPEGMNLQVNDPQLRAALELDPDPSRTRRRRAARRQPTTSRANAGGVRAADGSASRISLPPRPLRRNPYQHEIQAETDFAAMESSFETTLQQIVNELRLARIFQADELRDSIVAADGNLRVLGNLRTATSASDRIANHLRMVAQQAIDQAVQEANRQGVEVARQPVSDIEDEIQARAASIDELLRTDISQSASREAVRLTGGGLTATEVAEDTHGFLLGLTGAAMIDMLGGAVQQSINSGRNLVFQRDGQAGTIYASELLDSNTCSHCIAIDGTQYMSMDDALRDYPTGGFKDCEGRERCRGTVVKVYSATREEVPVA